ncbi:hypothetical protein MP228_004177 [Amoeboaphelidium protococcarum]|nr:hypothetical protein MP228_004177 [Amoeboaphelidium protococcarum]
MAIAASQNRLASFLLHIINIIFTIAGLAIAAGFLVAYILNLTGQIRSQGGQTAILWALIALGLIVACTGFLGFCGLCMGNKCLLITYLAVVITIFVAQVVLAATVYTQALRPDDAFWSAIGTRASVPVYVLLFIMCAIEFAVILFSCILLGSQRRRKSNYAGRVQPQNTPPVYYADPNAQYGGGYANGPVPSAPNLKQPTLPAIQGYPMIPMQPYTGPNINHQQEYVEYETVQDLSVKSQPQQQQEVVYEELDPDYRGRILDDIPDSQLVLQQQQQQQQQAQQSHRQSSMYPRLDEPTLPAVQQYDSLDAQSYGSSGGHSRPQLQSSSSVAQRRPTPPQTRMYDEVTNSASEYDDYLPPAPISKY